MWVSFLLVALFSIALLLLPGYLILRAFNLPRQISVMCATPVTSFLLATAGILLAAIGAKGVGPLLVVVLGVSLLMFAVLLVEHRLSSAPTLKAFEDCIVTDSKYGGMLILLYPLVSCAVMGLYFVLQLDGPSSFLQIGDNATHLNTITSMVDGGSLSSLSSDVYSAVTNESEVPINASSGFYPVGWHIVVAVAAFVCGVDVPLAENAVNLVFSAVVFPLSCLAIIRIASKDKVAVSFFGAFAVCACAAFPLRTLVVHQIYPNIAGFCVVFSVVCLGINVLSAISDRTAVASSLFAFILALVGGVLLHPNIAFACGMALVAYAAVEFCPRLVERRWALLENRKRRLKIVLCCAIVGVALFVWFLLLNSSALASLTNFLWTWTVSAEDALWLVLSMGLRLGVPQYVLALVVMLGFAYCLIRKDGPWLSVVYTLVCLIFFFNASGSPEVKRIFSGFWYTDPERTAALVSIFSVPLAAYGLYCIYLLICRFFEKSASSGFWQKKSSRGAIEGNIRPAVGVVVSCLAFFFLYAPFSLFGFAPSAIESTSQELAYNSNRDNALFYDAAEQAFVEKVKQTIPDNSLVINMPHDGSVFAYAANGLNVYYKSTSYNNEKQACEEIRLRLCDYAENECVRSAVSSTGAQYVMLLDRGAEKNYDSNSWDPDDWTGFDSLDSCSDFEIVLSDGNMRLYRISASAGESRF